MNSRIVSVWACTLLFGLAASAQDTPAISTIEEAWKRQEEATPTIRASIKETRIIQQGAVSATWSLDPFTARERNAAKKIIPPQTTRVELPGYVALNRMQGRFEYSIPNWSDKLGRFSPASIKQVVDNSGKVKTHYVIRQNETTTSSGIEEKSRRSLATDPQLWPVVTAVRGTVLGLTNCQLLSVKPTARAVTIAGISCVELESLKPTPTHTRKVWVAPDRNWTIIRTAVVANGRTTQQVTIKPELFEGKVWIPRSWEVITTIPGSKVQETIRAQVEQIELGVSLAPRHFDFAFPPGTSVYHRETKKVSKIAGEFDAASTPTIGEDDRQSNLGLHLRLAVSSALVLLCLTIGVVLWFRNRRNAVLMNRN